MSQQIRVFKLMSSEEVIAVLSGESDDGEHYILEKPLAIIIQPNPSTGQASVGFAPWTIGNDKKTSLRLRKNVVIIEPFEAQAELERGYIQSTTNIALA